ncbi:PEX13 [Candida pseudojiufengensis]|uniref:PEX13 n=1 Tax=Candida pseudojiufengensis TaxID=497109 RepID=UPI00222497D3|nr:PEX13 [Candida pseudojiufengensis]KAI5961865.1 PEX13 [Candida pseudojiufengensis]
MSTSQPRTKPWEVSQGTSAASTQSQSQPTTTTTTNTSTNPSIPDRPTSLTSDFNNMAETSPYGNNTTTNNAYGTSSTYGNRYGSSGYGSSMYGSGYGSGMYGGYGSGYGSSMYGGYGSSMYGNSMYGSGMYGNSMYGSGMYGNQNGMMQNGFGEGTQATFHLIESIIGAVGGFAQMLEATYMATHSSFFTMINLAEQFGNLKNALGSLLGIFALIKFLKKIFWKITGQSFNNGLNLNEFNKFEKNQKKLEDKFKKSSNSPSGGSKKPRISFKPLILFLAASIGFPYLLSKAIQYLNEQNKRKQMELQQQQQQFQNPNGLVSPFDPTNLQFAKAIYEFNPENPSIELELKPNELVAILSKLDPLGNESKWWKVRSRSGKMGYVPSNYLSVIERKSQQKPALTSSQSQPSLSPAVKQVESAPIIPQTNELSDIKPDQLLQEFKNMT